MKRKRKFISWFSVICMLFPRIFIAYALYGIPSVLAVKFTYRKTGFLLLTLILLFLCWLISSQMASISITSFMLAVLLQLPFIMFLLQFDIKEGLDGLFILRVLNIAICIFSFANMTLFYGFPFQLPYINYVPDVFSAFYFFGGAKIVTIIGFFGVAAELFVFKERKHWFWLTIALMNFVIPNYLIGIIMGVGALTFVAIRKKPALIPLLLIVVLTIAPYAADRSQSLNQGFATNVGMNPKVFAYYSILMLYNQFPLTVITGTGMGAFSSTPALWSSTYISALSTNSIPKLPFFAMSQYHAAVLGPTLSLLANDKFSLESSASKPYTSVTTIFTEYGLLFGIAVMVLALAVFKGMGWSKKYTITIACFSVFIFTTDQWHDSLFFGYMLLLSRNISTYST